MQQIIIWPDQWSSLVWNFHMFCSSHDGFSVERATICNSPHRNLMEKAVGCCGPLAPLDNWFIWTSIWVLFWKVPLSHFSSILAEIFYNPVRKKCTEIMADIYLWEIYTYVRYIQSICLYALPTAKTSFALGIWPPMPKFGYSPCTY